MKKNKKQLLSKVKVCVYCKNKIKKTSRYVVIDKDLKLYAHVRCNRAIYIINDEYHEQIENEHQYEPNCVMLSSIL